MRLRRYITWRVGRFFSRFALSGVFAFPVCGGGLFSPLSRCWFLPRGPLGWSGRAQLWGILVSESWANHFSLAPIISLSLTSPPRSLQMRLRFPSAPLVSQSSHSLNHTSRMFSRMCSLSFSVSSRLYWRCSHPRSRLDIMYLSMNGIRNFASPWSVTFFSRNVYKILTSLTLITFQCPCVFHPCGDMF